MIYFNINIRKPSWWNRFERIKFWTGKTFIKNKYWEFQIDKVPELFHLELSLTTKEDHAGFNIEFALLGYEVRFTVYDCRHWDYINERWEDNVNAS